MSPSSGFRVQSEYSDWTAAIGYGVSASEGVRSDLGEADGADRAGFDEARQFSDRVFDRDRFVDAMHIVEVDMVDAEPLPRGVEGFANVDGAIVEEARAVFASTNRELGCERHPRTAAFVFGQELADHLFAEPIATTLAVSQKSTPRSSAFAIVRMDSASFVGP
jgi:hypothetical protein